MNINILRYSLFGIAEGQEVDYTFVLFKQIFLQLHQVNFKEQVVSSFLIADIPLRKLDHPSLKFLFASMGKVIAFKDCSSGMCC